MLVGVPLFAILYGYLTSLINNHLKEKNLPTNNEEYLDLERINSKTNKVVKEK